MLAKNVRLLFERRPALKRCVPLISMALLSTTIGVRAEGDPENGKLIAGRCTGLQVVPMLAGQPASYLVQEMSNYAEGRRKDTSRNGRMTSILQSLTLQDIEDIAAFFEAQKRY